MIYLFIIIVTFSQSEDDIRPEDELGDLINKSLLPGPNLEVTTGNYHHIHIVEYNPSQ